MATREKWLAIAARCEKAMARGWPACRSVSEDILELLGQIRRVSRLTINGRQPGSLRWFPPDYVAKSGWGKGLPVPNLFENKAALFRIARNESVSLPDGELAHACAEFCRTMARGGPDEA